MNSPDSAVARGMSRILNWPTLLILSVFGLCLALPTLSLLLWRAYAAPRSTAQITEGSHPKGAFRCSDQDADYGKVRIGQPVTHTFRLLNTSSETRRIVKVTPGCTCTKVDHFSKDVAPGYVGEVAVVVDTMGAPGIRQSSVLIETDDPIVPRLNPVVSCQVLPAVETNPSNLRFVPRESTSDFASQTIGVVGLYQGEQITLGDIQASDPMIVVTKATASENEPLHCNVTVNKDIPAGLTLAHLIINIEGSAQNSVRCPITIAKEAEMKAEPSLLELLLGKDSQQTVEFTVKALGQRSMEVRKVELADRVLHVVLQQVAPNEVLVRLEKLMVARDLDLKHICVSTNHGELRVPIMANSRPRK